MAARGTLTPVERRAVEASPFAEIYPPTPPDAHLCLAQLPQQENEAKFPPGCRIQISPTGPLWVLKC